MARASPRRRDGSWLVSRPAGTQDAGKPVEVTVGHDGIHEVLSGRLAPSAGAATAPPPGAAPAGAASSSAAPSGGASSGAAASGAARLISGSHKQFYWWILNIAIVLIAAIAISRRMS
jgi:membrane-associated phospholipid phosphatase